MNYFRIMNIPSDMSDLELKKFINKGEQFSFEKGDLYQELIDAGYPKERIDTLIAAKKKREAASFKTNAIFLSIILTSVGILAITGYFGQNMFSILIGSVCCVVAWFVTRMAFK